MSMDSPRGPDYAVAAFLAFLFVVMAAAAGLTGWPSAAAP
jgi:hypothetical protein